MASPVKIYQQEMHANLGFFATWLPGDPLEIGDVGVLEGGRFRRIASLQELNIVFETDTGQSGQNVQYTSTQGTKISLSAGAAAAAIAKAEIKIDFSREGAFVFHASGLQAQRLQNRAAVGEQIVEAYKNNRWKKEWFLVEALHIADRATIIVSEDSSAGLVLVANSETPVSAISLADPKISLAVAATEGRIMNIVGAKRLHPLYSCLRLKDSFFRGPSIQPVRGTGAGDEVPFARPGIDDLLNS